MRAEDARAIAETLVSSTDLQGYRAAFAECRRSEASPGEWVVLFDLYSQANSLMDGPMVVVVDEQTRSARMKLSL